MWVWWVVGGGVAGLRVETSALGQNYANKASLTNDCIIMD
jgi:hypothetical protein